MILATYRIITESIMIVKVESARAEPRSQGLRMKKLSPWDESMHYPLGDFREK